MLRNLSWMAVVLAGLATASLAQKPAGSSGPAAAWQRVVELDRGPQVRFKTRDEAKTAAVAHQAQQERALREFIVAYPQDEHAFEARLRLARLLQIRATMGGGEGPRGEARKILDDLYLTATPEQRAEVDFARLSYSMRTLRMSDAREREQLLTAVSRFKAEYPRDRRLASLLTEVAGLFQREPEQMRAMLLEAGTLTSDPALKTRIGDDLKRLDMLGKPIELKMPGRSGRLVDLEMYRGKIVLLLFFGEFSPPAAEAVTQLKRLAATWPKGAVQIVGVSLDSSADELTALVRRENIDWPVAWDGKSWRSPVIRGFGLNRLPTAWLIDQRGTLRSLNALENTTDQVNRLLLTKGG